ncbi:MAG: hypothetical protein ABSH48_23105 [Verrucomicrobiota bacterium]|jgi:hypothetical protein
MQLKANAGEINQQKMSSKEDGFATATLELMNGYPGYFYVPGDGSYICAMDDRYGLPIRLAGDAGPDINWLCGFNRGLLSFINSRGLPWNSRSSSLNILADLPDYFHRNGRQCTRLELAKKAYRTDEWDFSLRLEQGEIIKLESQSLFHDPGTVPQAMMPYRAGPPRQAVPAVPKVQTLRPGTKSVRLWVFSDAQCVECIPAFSGSNLVVFRFSEFTPNSFRRREVKELFVVLDTQLAEWIPGTLSQPFLANPFC